MIGYLKGEILDLQKDKIMLGIGGVSGMIGYRVVVAERVTQEIALGQQIALFIYTHVREDALDLYGFQSRLDQDIFLTLLNVNGIGPKSALMITSAVEAPLLIRAIIQGDQSFLEKIPGIGKKTAQRVVLELRDSMKKKYEVQGHFLHPLEHEGAHLMLSEEPGVHESKRRLLEDAQEALMSLGYRASDVYRLLQDLIQRETGHSTKVEDLICRALKQLHEKKGLREGIG